jgi:hypothetical protein
MTYLVNRLAYWPASVRRIFLFALSATPRLDDGWDAGIRAKSRRHLSHPVPNRSR